MSADTEYPDPDDMFADTRMSFGDHIEDLRWHMIRALKGLVVGMIVGFWPLGPYVLDIINAPVEQALTESELRKFDREVAKKRDELIRTGATKAGPVNMWLVDRKKLAKTLGLDPDKLPPVDPTDAGELPEDLRDNFVKLPVAAFDELKITEDQQRAAILLRPKRVTTLSVTEMFFVYMKISFFAGLVLSSPWVFYHLWMFIAAGLYPNEKRLVNVYLPFSVLLFVAGVALCEFVAMKQAVRGLLWFNEWLGVDADIRLQEWLSFAIMMPLIFGLTFQTPLVMMFLHKVGIVTIEMLRQYRRGAWFALAIIAAILAPAPTADGLLLLWVPMVALYELGILLCVWQGKREALTEWEQEEKGNEMVEV
jgi:sec-independent protein translocase protein TatC